MNLSWKTHKHQDFASRSSARYSESKHCRQVTIWFAHPCFPLHGNFDSNWPTQFSKLISWARLTKGLAPLFPPSTFQFYYSFLNETLRLTNIYIHIPYKAWGIFQVFNMLPFPVVINTALDSTPIALILVSADFLHTALPVPYFSRILIHSYNIFTSVHQPRSPVCLLRPTHVSGRL